MNEKHIPPEIVQTLNLAFQLVPVKYQIRILLSYGYPHFKSLIKQGIQKNSHHEIVCEASDFEEVLSQLETHRIDVVVLGAQMAKGNLFDTITQIRKNHPAVKILLTGLFVNPLSHSDKKYLSLVDGMISQDVREHLYVIAIEAIMGGGFFAHIVGSYDQRLILYEPEKVMKTNEQ